MVHVVNGYSKYYVLYSMWDELFSSNEVMGIVKEIMGT